MSASNTTQSIDEAIQNVTNHVISWRRYLHQNPELSFREVNTSQYVFDKLHEFGGLEISRPTNTSVMATLKGGHPGKVLAIRADMDALPIQEETSFSFASRNDGVMHACGHDGHTAMLLGAVKILTTIKNQLCGEIRFLFQHAEELFPGGAQEMVNAGVMDGVDYVIGIHLMSNVQVGKIAIKSGAQTAAPDTFRARIIGKGGHGAFPHTAIDSVSIAAQVITNLQHVVARYCDPLDPLVLSVTTIQGGTAHNIIPGAVEFGGTVRSYNPQLRNEVPVWMERVIQGVTSAHGASYEFDYEKGYAPVINDPEFTERVAAVLKHTFGDEAVITATPSMAGDDYSAFQNLAPGTFFMVGAGYGTPEEWFPHHHPKFAIHEDALAIGVKAYVAIATQLLCEA